MDLEVPFQVQKEEAKLFPFDKVRPQFVLARHRVFGRLIRPHEGTVGVNRLFIR